MIEKTIINLHLQADIKTLIMDNRNHNVIGDISNPYQQNYIDTCAIKSQQIILNEFGVPVTEDQCVQYSIEHGWYSNDGSGTNLNDVGNLLKDAGIPCTQTGNANIYDLVNELQQGHKVIVGVDSGELWDNSIWDWLKDFFFGGTADHALIVAGIDLTDPDHPMVVLTDPGTGSPAQPYPLEQFMDAWADSECFMVSTDIATPHAIESFEFNGLTGGHLNTIAGVDYYTFNDFLNYSHQIDYATQGAQLYNLFDVYPDMGNIPFNDALVQMDMPLYDPTISMIAVPNTDVFSQQLFPYSYVNVFDSGLMTTGIETDLSRQHSLEVLQEIYDDCLQHAQDCIDNGMPISAIMWQNQANETEQSIEHLIHDF